MRSKKRKGIIAEENPLNPPMPPDDQMKPLEEGQAEEAPQVFKIVKRENNTAGGRRNFLKTAAGVAGIAIVADLIAGSTCDNDDGPTTPVDPTVTPVPTSPPGPVGTHTPSPCTCQYVCSCDTDSGGKVVRDWKSRYNGGVCTCNLVCSCDTVRVPVAPTATPRPCTCHTVCTCQSVIHYWYPN